MKALVTGCAGFIGSTLTEELLIQGWNVTGVDCFTPYYEESRKQSNLRLSRQYSTFKFVNEDLRVVDLKPLVEDVDVIFHHAAQPGVRLSWSDGFNEYVENNISVTQRLLEAAKNTDLKRFIYASSSSIYGNATRYPCLETDLPAPYSPYGVTKLAAEQLCYLYACNWGVPTTSLRYFTVYGPRQRPDMAMHRLVSAILKGEPFPLNGDGEQIRDFTFVKDVVKANIAAAEADIEVGAVMNIAGGGSTTMNEVIRTLEELTEQKLNIDRKPDQAGDVRQTGGSIELANKLINWKPDTSIRDGLTDHVFWLRQQLETSAE